MSSQNNDFHALIDAYCRGDICDVDFRQLNSTLKSDSDARRVFLEHITLYQVCDELLSESEQPKSVADDSAPATVVVPRLSVTERLPPLSLVVIGVLALLIGVSVICWDLIGGLTASNSKQTVANSSEPLRYVGKVVKISEGTVWSTDTDVLDFLCRFAPGDRIGISSGLVEVEYFSGARLILRAPSTLVITGAASASLERGELTGNVSQGEFSLQTPGAKILDLGTEFGIVVDEKNNTDVCVFDGKVQVSKTSGSRDETSSILLTEGMAARVDKLGISSIDPAIEGRFTRVMADSKNLDGQVSLLDVFSERLPGQSSLGCAIAPDTGLPITTAILSEQNDAILDQPKSKDVFATMEWLPLVDGVFIPNQHGISVQIDSTGTTVSLPKNEGITTAPIWARRNTGTPDYMFRESFWGHKTRIAIFEKLKSSKIGMMGLHPNVGLTFDLAAIRNRYQSNLIEFSTAVENLDNKRDYEPMRTDKSKADFRVLVDGEVRASRLSFGKLDGPGIVTVQLKESDRFLTIVSTDCGSISFDHVVLIDPVMAFDVPQ